MTLKQYAKQVFEMRKMQKEYFRSRTPLALTAAKQHEKQLDTTTDEILNSHESLFSDKENKL
jgi:hypothetical protein